MRALTSTFKLVSQAVVAGLALAFVVVWLAPGLIDRRAPVTEEPVQPPPAAPASYADAVDLAAPAVANIYTTRVAPPRFEGLPGGSRLPDQPPPTRPGLGERVQHSLGSGVVFSPNGYVLTNDHVIEGADEIRVAFSDGREAVADVVGTDPDTDLALLRVPLDDLPAIRFGRSDTLRPGDVVLAIGNPFGIGQTVTQGVVSATGRNTGLNIFENYIQTDASINFGSSGGALINTSGDLVGVNTGIFSGNRASEGIGFAIPVNLVRGVMDQLIEQGRVIRGWIGVSALTLTPEVVSRLGLAGENAGGIVLTGVYPNMPGDLAGLKLGDIITRINGEQIVAQGDALARVARLAPGTTVTLNGLRNGEPFEVTARVMERPLIRRRGS